MKTLYLIRHAKASWDNAEVSDFDRALTSTGEIDAHTLGKQLHDQGVIPDLIISSPAKRAIDTAQIMAEELNFPLEKVIMDTLIYNGDMEELVELITRFDRKVNTALFFGHNPNLTWLVHYFCEGAKMNIPTCGIAGIYFTIHDWAQLVNAEGKLTLFIHPQNES